MEVFILYSMKLFIRVCYDQIFIQLALIHFIRTFGFPWTNDSTSRRHGQGNSLYSNLLRPKSYGFGLIGSSIVYLTSFWLLIQQCNWQSAQFGKCLAWRKCEPMKSICMYDDDRSTTFDSKAASTRLTWITCYPTESISSLTVLLDVLQFVTI